jgi:hypothetical protein
VYIESPAALAAEWFSIAVLSAAMEKILISVLSAARAEAPQGRDKRAVSVAYASKD